MKPFAKYTVLISAICTLAISTAIFAQNEEPVEFAEIQIPQNCPTWVYVPGQKGPFLHRPRRCPIEGDVLQVQEWQKGGNVVFCYKVVGVVFPNVVLQRISSGSPTTYALNMATCPVSAWDFLAVDNEL